MHRAFVHLASVGIRDGAAQYDRSYRRKRERHDDEKRQHIPQPWKSFMWLAVHGRPAWDSRWKKLRACLFTKNFEPTMQITIPARPQMRRILYSLRTEEPAER